MQWPRSLRYCWLFSSTAAFLCLKQCHDIQGKGAECGTPKSGTPKCVGERGHVGRGGRPPCAQGCRGALPRGLGLVTAGPTPASALTEPQAEMSRGGLGWVCPRWKFFISSSGARIPDDSNWIGLRECCSHSCYQRANSVQLKELTTDFILETREKHHTSQPSTLLSCGNG